MTDGNAMRFNAGKPRYDLVPAYAHEQLAKVLSKGAEKYSEHNWRRGMKWSSVLSSLERHLAAVKRGEDFDRETGLLHSAHIMCNAAFLTEYYRIYPQGDDRPHIYFSTPRICIDLGCFVPESENKNGLNTLCPINSRMDFAPYAYVSIGWALDQGEINEWFAKCEFPKAPLHVLCAEHELKKITFDIILVGNYEMFLRLGRAGYCCYLYTNNDNSWADVGFRRINELNELPH